MKKTFSTRLQDKDSFMRHLKEEKDKAVSWFKIGTNEQKSFIFDLVGRNLGEAAKSGDAKLKIVMQLAQLKLMELVAECDMPKEDN